MIYVAYMAVSNDSMIHVAYMTVSNAGPMIHVPYMTVSNAAPSALLCPQMKSLTSFPVSPFP